ncbi:hypothetical protein B0A49_03494 [Cryomyces minteri]|uniref:Uncharacterized protein n=1 Tax=Cryomyces minteri TaxID=331657 RepID=A0A4U0XJN9_9PEZI|nr:hypothetical protein B0A49_03494 [Cryomyces minteri]
MVEMKEVTNEEEGYESGPEPVLATSSKRKRSASLPKPVLESAEDAGVTKKARTDGKEGSNHETAAHSSYINYFAASSDNDEEVDEAASAASPPNRPRSPTEDPRTSTKFTSETQEPGESGFWEAWSSIGRDRSLSRPKLRGLHRLAKLTSGNVHEAERVLLQVVAKRQALSEAERMRTTLTNGDVAAAVAEVERRIREGEAGKDYVELDDGTKILRPKSGRLRMASQAPAETEDSDADETKEEEGDEEDMEDKDDDDDEDEEMEFNGFSDIDEEEE